VYIGGERLVRDGRHLRRDEMLARYRESVLRMRQVLQRTPGWSG
jgi:hypothetical protein